MLPHVGEDAFRLLVVVTLDVTLVLVVLVLDVAVFVLVVAAVIAVNVNLLADDEFPFWHAPALTATVALAVVALFLS